MKIFLLITLFFCCSSAFFYLPGVAPRDYLPGDLVDLKVNKLTSVRTQVPYDYYSLPWCRPDKVVESSENLGEILRGDRIENSAYTIIASVPIVCQVLCQREYSTKDLKKFCSAIDDEYRHHWILDNLPAAVSKTLQDPNGNTIPIYEEGFPIGAPAEGREKTYELNNHISLKIWYHTSGEGEGLRIVGFEVEPRSIQHDEEFQSDDPNAYPKSCVEDNPAPQIISRKQKSVKVIWTYSVSWLPSDVKWGSRWDIYLYMTDDQIHWFSIINSLMIVLFLTGMVAMIMMRTLHADFRRYRESLEAQEEIEEFGWKLVHGDVFRPPVHPMLLSVFVGTGVQVVTMTLMTMIFAVLGFLSPANRGSLMTAFVVLFVLAGTTAGYTSARLCKLMKYQNWKRCTLMTALLLPGIVFGIFLVLNACLASVDSSGTVPFTTLLSLMALWFGISTPLVFVGSFFGYRAPAIEPPVRTNQIPRQVPEQVWYMQPLASILMGGILPFGAVFIELFFILSSIWQHQFYYMFSFLFIVFFILVLTCAEITIVMCYFQLCSEDYHWWWRSYLTSGASAFYMFIYSIFYFFTKLTITKFLSAVLFFGYTLIMSLAFFVLTGAIGFIACFIFVRKIYSAVKVE